MGSHAEFYDQDLYAWTQVQAALLDARQFDALDIAHLVEEITSLGISQKHAWGGHLLNLVMHLLTWQYQPDGRQTEYSWWSSITNARDEIEILLEESPSLRREVPALMARRYRMARRNAAEETPLPETTFPPVCPWTPQQVLDADFWPEGEATP